MKKRIKLTIDVANKIKREEYHEFAESNLKDQYRKACRSLSKIIDDNHNFDNMKDSEVYNVISFLGGRGTGKTSAMFSFSDFLRDYDKIYSKELTKEESELPEWEKLGDGKLSFLMLDAIDTSMFGKDRKESILDYVLTQMWDLYDKSFRRGLLVKNEKASMKENVEKSFGRLRKDYNTYFRKSPGNEISTIHQLHELAGGLNLRKTLYQFVEEFLSLFYDNMESYLVIVIDDIDMAGEKSFLNLEQIHLFMNIPKIIVLLSADLKRLRQICGKYYMETYIAETELSSNYSAYIKEIFQEKEEFVDNYLEKIIASNMRVYMPNIYEGDPYIQNKKNDGEIEDINVKDIILETLAQNGMEFDSTKENHHFLEERTFRSSVNLLYEINEIQKAKTAEIKKELAEEWLRKSLKDRLTGRIRLSSLKEAAEKIDYVDKTDLNQYVVGKISRELREYEEEEESVGFSMGDIFYLCSRIEGIDYESKDFVNFVMAFYVYIFHDLSNNEILNSYYKDSIWKRIASLELIDQNILLYEAQDYIERLNLCIDIDTSGVQRLRKILNGEEEPLGFLKDLIDRNKENIRVFQIMLAFFPHSIINKLNEDEEMFLGMIKYPDSGVDLGASSSGVAKEIDRCQIVIYLNRKLRSVFRTDMPLITTKGWDVIYRQFKECFIKLLWIQLKEIMDRLSKERVDGEKNSMAELDEIVKEDDIKEIYLFDEIYKWNERYSDVMCLLPIKNVELIYHLGKMVNEENLSFADMEIAEKIKKIFDNIGEKLQESKKIHTQYEKLCNAYESHPIIKQIRDKKYIELMQEYLKRLAYIYDMSNIGID